MQTKYLFPERETLISALESEFEDNENCRLFVSEIPTADVLGVVRCKDCANGCHKTDKTVRSVREMLSRIASEMRYTIQMMRDIERWQNQGCVFYQPKRRHPKKQRRKNKRR